MYLPPEVKEKLTEVSGKAIGYVNIYDRLGIVGFISGEEEYAYPGFEEVEVEVIKFFADNNVDFEYAQQNFIWSKKLSPKLKKTFIHAKL